MRRIFLFCILFTAAYAMPLSAIFPNVKIPREAVEKYAMGSKGQDSSGLYKSRGKRETFGPSTGNIIKVGWTYGASGEEVPYSLDQNAFMQFFFGYINNVTDGIIVNGTRYHIQQFVYDDGSDGETRYILYETLVLQDNVDFLISAVSNTDQSAVVIAEKYGVPLLNGANYATAFVYPTGLNWTFSTNINALNLAKGCISQLGQAGVKTAVVAGPEIFQAALGGSTNYSLQTLNSPIEILDYVILDETKLLDPTQVDEYMAPFYARWSAMQPDAFIGGAGDTPSCYNLVSSMRRALFNVKAQYHWEGIDVANLRRQLGWQGETLMVGSQFDSTLFNFSDPFLGNSQNYVRLYNASFGLDSTYFDVVNVLTGIVGLRAIQLAGTLDKEAVRYQIQHFNESTIAGLITMGPNGYLENVPYYCYQIGYDQVYRPLHDPTNPYDLPNSVSIAYAADYSIIYPPGWVDYYTPKTYFQRNRIWILCVAIITPFVIVLLVWLGALIYRNYFCLCFPKDEVVDGMDEP